MRLIFDICEEASSLKKFLDQNKLYINDTPSYCFLDSELPVHRVIYKSNSSDGIDMSSLDVVIGRAYIVYKKSKESISGFNISMELEVNNVEEFLK